MSEKEEFMSAEDAMAGRPATKKERESQPYSSLEWYGNASGFLGLAYLIYEDYREKEQVLNKRIKNQKEAGKYSTHSDL